MHGVDGFFRDVLQGLRVISDAFAEIQFVVATLDRRLQGLDAAVFGLHTTHSIANHFSRITVEPACDFVLDEALHLGRQVDVHGHRNLPNVMSTEYP